MRIPILINRQVCYWQALLVCGLALLMAASGCSMTKKTGNATKPTTDWKSAFKKESSKPGEYGVPERMAVIWTDSIASAGGVSSVRGFGGRVYFYDGAGDPIRVDGEMSVYAFDDTDGEDKTMPDRVYRFTREDFQKHFGETQLGPSYSIWLPWDKMGGDQKSIALLPMFKTAENQVVKSEQSLNFLPGKNPPRLVDDPSVPFRVLGSSSTVTNAKPSNARSGKSGYDVQLVSNAESIDANQVRHDRTTTIDVPRQMTRRMRNDLASATVESVAANMQAQVSFGPSDEVNASNAIPSSNRPTANLPSGTPAKPPQSEEATSRPRAVFGAPGALK